MSECRAVFPQRARSLTKQQHAAENERPSSIVRLCLSSVVWDVRFHAMSPAYLSSARLVCPVANVRLPTRFARYRGRLAVCL